jgi:hypothetical protein
MQPGAESLDPEKAEKLAQYYDKKEKTRVTKEWGTQRCLLAMVDKGMGGDGTVAYYVVGIQTLRPRLHACSIDRSIMLFGLLLKLRKPVKNIKRRRLV